MVKTFTHESMIPSSVSEMVHFHQNEFALKQLTMPPILLQVIRDERSSLSEGEIEFKLWFGPFPIRWRAKHEEGPVETSFRDIQLEGPMAKWEHDHIFKAEPDGVKLIDRIRYSHKSGFSGILTRLIFDGLPLRILFIYRHWKTKKILTSQKIKDRDS